MKKFLIVLFVLFSVNLLSQTNDTIILNTGEIIPCQIHNVSKSGLVTYYYINSDGDSAMAQKVTESIKEIRYDSEKLDDSISQKDIFIMPGISDTVSLLLSDAMKQIEKSRKLTNAGIALGVTANTCVIINAGVLSGNVEQWQGITHVIGLSTSISRGFLSFVTPNHLKKATNKLLLARAMSGDITMLNHTLNHIQTARRASIAVPVLGLVGWNLIHVGILGLDMEGTAYNVCYIAGWACAAASLTCTFISSYHISRAKKSLQDDVGTLNLGMNKYGIGISYNF
jgi:hypothetical protein